MARIVIINGDAHPQGATTKALNEMAGIFNQEGIETCMIQIGDQAIRGCADCGACKENGRCVFTDDPVNTAVAELESADGLIVGSPVFFHSPSGTVLSFLDRLFRCASFSMERKVGACVVAKSEGSPIPAIDTLNQYFAISGMKNACVSFWGQEESSPSAEGKDPTESFRELAQRMIGMIQALGSGEEDGETAEIEDDYETTFSDGDFEKLRKRPVTAFILDAEQPVFPDPEYTSDVGLLAIGGKFNVEWLVAAYSRGIFPWIEEGLPLMWFAPESRTVIFPSELHISKSMAKFMRNHQVTLEINRDFADTMHRCRCKREGTEDGTWITDDVEKLYLELHRAGYAFSAECFVDGQLAGGLYNVRINRCVIGESMFSDMPNGSKMALALLVQRPEYQDCIFDTQVPSAFLTAMGARPISYDEYRQYLRP